jgi:hypothetical protein
MAMVNAHVSTIGTVFEDLSRVELRSHDSLTQAQVNLGLLPASKHAAFRLA